MRLKFAPTPVLAFFAILFVVGCIAISSGVNTAFGSDHPSGKDLNEVHPRPLGIAAPAGPRVDKPRTYPSLPTVGPAPRGIIQSSQGRWPGSEYVIQNRWQDQIAGQWVQIYAGNVTNDTMEGVVLVVVSSSDWTTSKFVGPFRAGRLGSLRIVDAVGTILTLQSSTGGQLKFDAVAEHFV